MNRGGGVPEPSWIRSEPEFMNGPAIVEAQSDLLPPDDPTWVDLRLAGRQLFALDL